jgi:UMF1 family MFS transporter
MNEQLTGRSLDPRQEATMVRIDSQSRPPKPQRPLSTNSPKHSFTSHSSSFEADDERSSSEHSMGEDRGFRDSPSQYAGEDTRLTSRKELSGWYMYGFAAEVFVICGIGELFQAISKLHLSLEARRWKCRR